MIEKTFLWFFIVEGCVSNEVISFCCGAKDICTQNKKNCGNHMATVNKVCKKYHFRLGAIWLL